VSGREVLNSNNQRRVRQHGKVVKKRKKNISAPKAVMVNNWTGQEDSTAVGVLSEKILHQWAQPSEELESRDSSPLSLAARSGMVMVRWALSLGGGASRGSTEALGVRGVAPGVGRRTVEGPAWCPQRDPCCPASVVVAILVPLVWLLGGRGNHCCGQSALPGS